MVISNIDFGRSLILAPMAGVTDVGFRDIASLYGADATYSEMLSARAMLHNPKKTALMTIYSPSEKIRIGQIFGHESDIMKQALTSPLLEHYHVIDINMGCPAPKIVRNGEGAALLKNLKLASEIISQCAKSCAKPLSVKIRLGYDKDNGLEIARMCEENGAKFITVHGRTAAQGYSGRADLDAIARIKSGVKIPVVGNGDVFDEESYQRMLETGVDGVMIGRGALGKPFIFSRLKGIKYDYDVLEIIKRHIQILEKYYQKDWLTKYFRKHILWYLPFIKGQQRLKLATSDNLEDSIKMIEELLKGVKNEKNS